MRAAGALVALGLILGPSRPARADTAQATLRIFADTDDDDADGASDRDEVVSEGDRDVEWMVSKEGRFSVRGLVGDSVRLVLGKRSYTAASLPSGMRAKQVGLQGLLPGTSVVDLGSRRVELSVCGVEAVDADGQRVDLARSHASISRTLPGALARYIDDSRDEEALSWRFLCPKGALPGSLRVVSRRPSGEVLDVLEGLPIASGACPAGSPPDLDCGQTEAIRAAADWADRTHPAAAGHSLRAEVGGRLLVEVDGRKAGSIRVGGPRHTNLGAIDRYRARLRFHVIRGASHGQPAVGGNDAGARSVVRAEAQAASMIWGQCGIHFGKESDVAVEVEDPPPRYLLAVGCETGLPASGGALAVVADGVTVRVTTHASESPVAAAHDVARALEAAGFRAVVSPNARIAPGALRTADVLVRRRDGSLVDLRAAEQAPLSTDSTLPVCLGEVDLADGLRHFDDLDAAAGTLEERTLVKAYDDGDPTTIDVFVVPSFSKTGRIGESFIDGDGSSIQNVVIVDRMAVLSGSRSYALAHELGHVLLDMPGHPDDFGVDRPWVLMDADAADPSIFGPRRLPVEECERAIRQSGPGAIVPLLEPWPLFGTSAAASPKSGVSGSRSR